MAQPDVNMAWGEASRLGFPHPPAAFAGGRIALYPIGAWAPSAFFRDSASGQWLVRLRCDTHAALQGGTAIHLGGGTGVRRPRQLQTERGGF